jgi:hypothetical protein
MLISVMITTNFEIYTYSVVQFPFQKESYGKWIYTSHYNSWRVILRQILQKQIEDGRGMFYAWWEVLVLVVLNQKLEVSGIIRIIRNI